MRAIFLFLALAACNSPAAEVRVVDGDTLVLDGERIRLNGIDAPESDTISGEVATRFMRHLVDGRPVVVTERFKKDRYGRTVASVEADEDDLACAMLESGNAEYVGKWDEESATIWKCGNVLHN